MEEIWKDIPDYNGYQVSNKGRVRTHNKTTYTKRHGIRHWKNRILKYKGKNYKTGYRVSLWKNGKCKDYLVARLVLSTFTNVDINTDLTVNHKDGNRFNNILDNLEWLTRADNIRYGFEHNQYRQDKTILYNNDEKYIFRSKSKADEFLNRTNGYICDCIKRNKKAISKINNTEYSIKIIK